MKLNNLSLVAILGLGSCSMNNDRKFYSPLLEETIFTKPTPSQNNATGQTYASSTNGSKVSSYNGFSESTKPNTQELDRASLGVLELSANPYKDAVRFSIKGFDAYVELPIRENRNNNNLFDSYDRNTFEDYQRYPWEHDVQLPAGQIAKIGRDFIINNIPWLKDTSSYISGIANAPVKYAFGGNSGLLFELGCVDGDIQRINRLILGIKWDELYTTSRHFEGGLEVKEDDFSGSTFIGPFFAVRW